MLSDGSHSSYVTLMLQFGKYVMWHQPTHYRTSVQTEHCSCEETLMMAPERSDAVTTASNTFSLFLSFKLVLNDIKLANSPLLSSLGMIQTTFFLLLHNVLTI